MAQTLTPSAGSAGGVQTTYPRLMSRGNPGQIADLSNCRVISGSNETGARLAFGIPVVINDSGTMPNSVTPLAAEGSILGITVRSETHARASHDAATPYEEGIPDLQEVNILQQGTIYLEVVEAVEPGDTLRYFASGANAGKWGTTASAGNSLALDAGNWIIREAGDVGQVIALEINTPAELSFTADT